MLQKKFYIPIGALILAICAVGLFSLCSEATISDSPCAPSNPDCNWRSKIIVQFVWVYPMACDEGHIHGELVGILRISYTAYWCTVHTDVWSEPLTFYLLR